jgi:uncharacterized membrane protein
MADVGPVEFMVVAFPGNKFTGEITPALKELINSGTIRIIDLAFVTKDADGNVAAMELEDLASDVGQAFQAIEAVIGELVSQDDLMAVGKSLEPNSSAALLVWEDTWATKFVQALANAGAMVLDLQRVPRDVIDAALEYSALAK